jgi:transcription elongation factor Elf1
MKSMSIEVQKRYRSRGLASTSECNLSMSKRIASLLRQGNDVASAWVGVVLEGSI